MKRILIIRSHSLTDYQKCPKRYEYTSVLKLEPVAKYMPFEKGTLVAKVLDKYYHFKAISPEVTKDQLLECIELIRTSPLEQEVRDFLEIRFLQYHRFYQNELWIPITSSKAAAIEQSFSKIIHEDNEYLFVYEGTPDLLVWLNGKKQEYSVVDHKTQSRRELKYHFNNQALGYVWACGTKIFTYNYFGLQRTGEAKDWFHRSSIIFTHDQIEQWRQATVQWCYKIVNDKNYIPSWQCESKYGVCAYHELCEVTNDKVRLIKLKTEYKEKEYV